MKVIIVKRLNFDLSDGPDDADELEEGEQNERDFDVVMDEEMYQIRNMAIAENEYQREQATADSDKGLRVIRF